MKWLIKTAICFSLISLMQVSYGQSLKFAPLDENFTRVLKFHAVDTILIVFPDNYPLDYQDSAVIENYVFWGQYQKKPVYIYRAESTLINSDFEKNIQLFGPFHLFRNDMLLNIPIKQIEYGFTFNNQSFNLPEDAFFYINDACKRLYTCANSNDFPLCFRDYPVGFYPLNIFRKTDFVYNGYCSDLIAEEDINDLEDLREDYFSSPVLSQYFDVYYAKSLGPGISQNSIAKAMDDFADSLCFSLDGNPKFIPRSKVYFYAKREELQQFIAQPLSQTIYGKSLGNINHITGLNMSTLKHELGHTVIDNTLGKNNNPFWQEGFRQYTDYLFNKEAYKKDRQITIAQIDLLTEDLVNNKSNGYFSSWSHYPVSGVFVKFVVEKVGFVNFKEAYSQNSIEKLLSNHGYSVDEMVADFKNHLSF